MSLNFAWAWEAEGGIGKMELILLIEYYWFAVVTSLKSYNPWKK
jgi:hypothetical protein